MKRFYFICLMLCLCTISVHGQNFSSILNKRTSAVAKVVFPLLLEKAQNGNADAQYKVGMAYLKGNGVKKSKAEGEKWIHSAAAQGHAEAQAYIDLQQYEGDLSMFKIKRNASQPSYSDDAETLFLKGTEYYAAGDTVEAIKYVTWSAQKGLKEGQYSLALMYDTGEGKEINKAEAAKWYLKAAEQGFDMAQVNLGHMLAKGDGVANNDKEAVRWFKSAAEQGNATAQNNLAYMLQQGRGIKRSETQAVSWYRKAAEQGLARAQYYLANMLDNGQGTKRDRNEALIWWKRSAEQGFAQAQHAMGEVYRWSYSAKEKVLAEPWYRKAAEQGYAPSQTGLGVLYDEGIGVKQNYQTALEWYCLAASNGDPGAMYYVGRMYRDGKGMKKDYAEAYKWWSVASEYGETRAMYSIGLLYQYGTGVSENIDEAIKWYSQASSLGYDLATDQLKQIKKSQRLQRIMQENMEYRAQKERERKRLLELAEREREAYLRFVQQEQKAREERRQMAVNTIASINRGAPNYNSAPSLGLFGGSNSPSYNTAPANNNLPIAGPGMYVSPLPPVSIWPQKVERPSPTPTKPLATATDFPTSDITYQTDEPYAYQRMMYTVRISTYNGYQKAYVQVNKSTETLGKYSAFMIYADGTTVEDPSQYGLLGNNADYTIKLNKGGESIEVNGKTLYKATADTKAFNSAMTQQNLEILQEANKIKLDTSPSDKSSSKEHGTWVKCSNSNCVNGYDKTVLSSAVPSAMAPPHPHPGGYNCGICGKDYAHWHQRCPSCLPNKGREKRY